jgi:hypothetical protein
MDFYCLDIKIKNIIYFDHLDDQIDKYSKIKFILNDYINL